PAGERGRAYVGEKPGISTAIRDSFLLGYAPPGWDALVKALEARRVPHELAESGGLVRRRDLVHGQSVRPTPGAPPTHATHYDLFRDRVMFPLLGPTGDVIAFSGRTLVDNTPDGTPIPKYINSPEPA